MKHKTLMAVDPGENTAIALWDSSGNKIPIKTEYYDSKDINFLASTFKMLTILYKPQICVMEDARMLGSMTRSANKKFIKLCKIVGCYELILSQYNIPCKLVSVNKWKGTLKNKTLRKWIIDITGINYKPVHVLCAVGIGLNYKGVI